MPTEIQVPKYRIVEIKDGILLQDEIENILSQFPMTYNFALEGSDCRNVHSLFEKGTIEVYHDARVIALFPEPGKILSKAEVTNWDFPLRPDNMLDDLIGLRCCFHPKLSTFGVPAYFRRVCCQEKDKDELRELLDQIEIDVHKFPRDTKFRRYVAI